jgi:hypothetical protein
MSALPKDVELSHKASYYCLALDGSVPSPAQAPDDLNARFRMLVKRWKRETEADSSLTRMVRHPAYQEIIRMGERAVPLLLAELNHDPDFWFAALRSITGTDPVPKESAGKIREIAKAWIEWGREKGLLK